MKKWDKAVVYLYFLFLLLSPVVFISVSLILNAPASGELKAVVRVNESKGNAYALSLLKDENDPVELFSYALALKREGDNRGDRKLQKLIQRTRTPNLQ